MSDKSFNDLVTGYLNNQLDQTELASLLLLIQEEDNREFLEKIIGKQLQKTIDPVRVNGEKEDLIFSHIMERAATLQPAPGKIVPINQPGNKFSFLKFAAAASILFILSLGGYFLLRKEQPNNVVIQKTEGQGPVYDVEPGKNKAILTLANGSTIVLDDAKNGSLANEGNTKVIKLDGKLAYDAAGNEASHPVYNTIATPNGGQYQIELADGTLVWLNAASSLHFPTSFSGGERRVDITGEAYFEVAKNEKMPFIVNAPGSQVKVLGTHFNIMAYENEPVLKTTLLEGSVSFESGGHSKIISPGQQTQLLKNGRVRVLNHVDVENEVAWKNGYFKLDGVDIETLGRQLARWYGVEMVYEKKPADLFYADISRDMKLSKVLKALELTGEIRFRIEGNKIIVIQ